MSITFVLGAGFSAEHQFPLLRGLKERVIHYVEAEKHPSYASFLRPRNGFPDGLFYTGLKHVDPNGTLGFEELLIELKNHSEHPPCTIVNKVMRIGVARFLWCITFFIGKVETIYSNFASRLADDAGASKVITFNWDILVEKALTEVGAKWSYSLAGPAGSTSIIKPHGSINWSSFAQNPDRSAEYDAWRPIGPGSTLSFDSRDPLANPDLQEINPDLRYCLFPGDPDLPRVHADLARLWMDVRKAIETSNRVVFIGYSLPAYDTFARSEFKRLCASKAVEVFNPSQSALETYKSEIPHAHLEELRFNGCPYAKATSA